MSAASLGAPRLHARTLASTNGRARTLAAGGARHGTLVTADEQSAGRGRQGRAWTAGAGEAVLMSLILRDAAVRPLAPLAAAVACAEAVEALAPVSCRVKWPNDIWVGRRKLAGILIEGRPAERWAVLGIGLNVGTRAFPDGLARTATSLALAAPGPAPTVGEVLRALLAALDRWLAAEDPEVLEAWRARDALRGLRVSWSGGSGVATGVGEDGSLLVGTATGEVSLGAGEVHLDPIAEEGDAAKGP